MADTIFQYFNDKHILILGFGREGQSTYKFLKANRDTITPKSITIADKNPLSETSLALIEGDKIYTGDDYLMQMANADLVMKSPGISFKAYSIYREKKKIYLKEFPGVEISSQMDVFLRFCPSKILGVTGTKGKSTTTSLAYEIFRQNNKNAYLLGNIGTPVLDYWNRYDENSLLAVEMSSHQLQFVSHSPDYAIITNFFPEHLDHYKSYDEYIDSKMNIFRFQNEDAILILNANEEELVNKCEAIAKAKIVYVAEENKKQYVKTKAEYLLLNEGNVSMQGEIYPLAEDSNLIGSHQKVDALYAAAAAQYMGVKIENQLAGIREFKGISHRLEFVGKFKAVSFYNDSIATIPEATILAIDTLNHIGEVKTLIVGGMDRGISYQKLFDYIGSNQSIENIICLPDTGYQIATTLEKRACSQAVFKVETIQEAVALAYEVSKIGSICLFSPAAASYHRYKNFEERGDDFKKWVVYYGKN